MLIKAVIAQTLLIPSNNLSSDSSLSLNSKIKDIMKIFRAYWRFTTFDRIIADDSSK